MRIFTGFFICFMSQLTILSAVYPTQQPQRVQTNRPSENINIYNEEYPRYQGSPYGYYVNPIPTPDEAFPDSAEAERLFENLSEE